MAVSSVITINHTNETAQQVADLLSLSAKGKKEFLAALVNYLEGCQQGTRNATFQAQIGGTTIVRSSGTCTASSTGWAAADVITVNGQAITGRASGASTNEFNIPAGGALSLAAQQAAFATAVNACAVAAVASNVYAVAPAAAAQGTITVSTIVADNYVTIQGVTLTAKSSPSGENQFALGAGDNAAMANLAGAINGHSVLRWLVSASSSTNVCTVTARKTGPAGNLITLAKNGSPITVTGSGFLVGGCDQVGQYPPGVAADAAGVCRLYAKAVGAIGNAITLVKTTGANLTVSGATFGSGAGGNVAAVTYV